MNLLKNKRFLLGVLLTTLFLIASFFIYKVVIASSARNKIKVSYAKITSIKTGSGSFTDDGLNYSDNLSPAYSADSGYSAGNDSNDSNRIVRSFDEITYNFDFKISPKSGDVDENYEERTVDITVELTPEEAKYVSFSPSSVGSNVSNKFSFDGIDTYDSFSKSITLYILGAPNGTEIKPKFTIRESEDEETSVILGNNSDNYYYAFENDNYNNTASFINYMPTIVSSKNASVSFNLIANEDNQKATYDSKVGRYMTYLLGIKLDENSLRGLTIPNGDINFDVNFSQSGNNSPIFKDSWGRLYGSSKIEDIDAVVLNMPYSAEGSGNNDNKISYPGNVTITSKGNNTYGVKISDYEFLYNYVKVGADNGVLNDIYLSTEAFTVFSPRTREDGKDNINVNMTVSNGNTSINGTGMNIAQKNISSVNSYYESNDYSLETGFYDGTGIYKLAKERSFNGETIKNGTGSTSKGTNLMYKTKFVYNKTLSTDGLKEVIKIDSNAFRFIPINNKKDYEINVTCDDSNCSGISSDDFEVKFVSGTFDNSNYEATNISSLKLVEEDVSSVTSACAGIVNNLENYSNNQIQNLYGGPCIKAKNNVENFYNTIASASEGGKEIVLSKVIIQTKNGVKLPDNIVVEVKLGVMVRDISDITKTYQATTTVSTSDYDNKLYYYVPSVSEMCNPDNYLNTIYEGVNLSRIDSKLYGDSVKVVNFTSREELSVKNKNQDGTPKINYDTKDNDTITYNAKTIINDNNENVGADDVWFINDLVITITIPNELNYVDNTKYRKPDIVSNDNNGTHLTYVLPYTKPNMSIEEINFDTKINPTLLGNSIPITVSSHVYARNINGEEDTSIIGSLNSDYTIYATGVETVVVTQKVGRQGNLVEKNSEFSYVLNAYNNTSKDITDYAILDVLPYQGDENGSTISGSYKVKISLPSELSNAKVYCSKDKGANIQRDVFNKNNNFEECNLIDDFVSGVTAIRIDNINIARANYMGEIIVSLKAKDNNYSDKYINSFIGSTTTNMRDTSNKVGINVVSRKISGKVFIDVNGTGVKDGSEIYVEKVAATLYSLDNDNNLTEVKTTYTDKNGYYEFNNLDVGRYKVRFYDYGSDRYDLTLRYATMDTSKDSDAYKISDDGDAEISNKRVPDDPNGIRLTRTVLSADNMDMGLIPKRSFGFSMRKYITRIDLTTNGSLNTTNYDNRSSVAINVRNSLKSTAKVYYGIEITNDSTSAGYVNLIEENIPSGLIFDKNYEENKDWFEVNGVLQSDALSNVLINPGESKYLQIALYMPSKDQAGTFLNTVSILESTAYKNEELADDNNYVNANTYSVGEELTYGGVNWHVIGAEQGNDGQILTLLADASTITLKMGHTSNSNDVYKWSDSNINGYINSYWLNTTSLDSSVLLDNVVCDDASGLESTSYGGSMSGQCTSGIFTNSKVRLLTLEEYTRLKESTISDLSWLSGNSNYWLQNTSNVTPEYLQAYINAYNNSYKNKEETDNYPDVNYGILQNSVHNKAMFINSNNNINSIDKANKDMEIRPVIKVSSNNIVAE